MFFGERTHGRHVSEPIVLLTPRFSGVASERGWTNNGFNRFALVQTVETVPTFVRVHNHPAKAGC